MSWFSKLIKKRSAAEVSRSAGKDKNILVISDIHLGEDILNEGPQKLSEYIRVLNFKLSEFVMAHVNPCDEGRHWHLVINGDMFDFVKISLLPDEFEAEQMLSRPLTLEEKQRGLLNTPEHTTWKLKRILEIHRPIFKAFASFLKRGNSLTLIEGNHDAEFYFPEVRQLLREHLLELVRKEGDIQGGDLEAIAASIEFKTWFDASPGRYHIEHGHQYDELCSFEYHLAPFSTDEHQVLATPLNHRAVPYFAEILGDFSTHGVDKWTLGQWLRFSSSMGPRMLWVLLKLYFTICIEIVFKAGEERREALQAHRAQHEAQLENMMKETPYGFETLLALDGLRAKPADYSLLKTIHVFYLDRFILGAISLALTVPALVYSSGWDLFYWLIGIVGLGVGGQWGLSRIKNPDVADVLRRAAAKIADETGARYVVFGHSHHPELSNLSELGVGKFGERAFYLNSGSWVTREILENEKGGGMTYVEITSRGAALRRWINAKTPAEKLSCSNL